MRLKGRFQPPKVATGPLPLTRFKTRITAGVKRMAMELKGGPLAGTRIPVFSHGILPFSVTGGSYDCNGYFAPR